MDGRYRKARSVEREYNSKDSTPTRDEAATGYTPAFNKSRCKDYDERGFCLRGDLCKFDHGSDAVVLEDNKSAGFQTEAYIPGYPQSGIPFPPPLINMPPPGFETFSNGKRPYNYGSESAFKRHGFDSGRGNWSYGRGSKLVIRNIPLELNKITNLNDHFSKFGNLVNVQVQFEGDPGSALVTYSENEEAHAAFNSSEAVMNNRFIKVRGEGNL